MLLDNGNWYLTKVVIEHNHALSPGKARFFRCNKEIDDPVKKRLVLNDIAGVRTNKNFNTLVVEMGGGGGGMRIFLLGRKMQGILLKKQESYGLAKEVVKPFVIISEECKIRIKASVM
jgi:hypothetical protein